MQKQVLDDMCAVSVNSSAEAQPLYNNGWHKGRLRAFHDVRKVQDKDDTAAVGSWRNVPFAQLHRHSHTYGYIEPKTSVS